jgi:hypothetical protein
MHSILMAILPYKAALRMVTAAATQSCESLRRDDVAICAPRHARLSTVPASGTISTILEIWATHMKTTIEVQDDLLERAKRTAQREGTTLRALIEEGMRLVLRARARRGGPAFRVRTFKGDGLTPEFRDAGWERIRDEIYRDRGRY